MRVSRYEEELQRLYPGPTEPPALKGALAAFANGMKPKAKKRAKPKANTTSTVTTLATPEVKQAIAKAQAALKRNGVIDEFTKQTAIVRAAILAYAESFD